VLAFEADSIRLAITATNGEKIGYKKLPRVPAVGFVHEFRSLSDVDLQVLLEQPVPAPASPTIRIKRYRNE
jgi:hypothetical protein